MLFLHITYMSCKHTLFSLPFHVCPCVKFRHYLCPIMGMICHHWCQENEKKKAIPAARVRYFLATRSGGNIDIFFLCLSKKIVTFSLKCEQFYLFIKYKVLHLTSKLVCESRACVEVVADNREL